MDSFHAHLRENLRRVGDSYGCIPLLVYTVAIAAVLVAFHPIPPQSSILLRAGTDSTTAPPDKRSVIPSGTVSDPTTAGQSQVAGDSLVGRDTSASPLGPVVSDTSFADTSHVQPVDSSARVKHFTRRRHDPLSASGFGVWNSPFFLKPPVQYRREITLDSTGQLVTIRETVLNKDVKIPITMTLEEYIEERLKAEERWQWQATATDYRPTLQQGGLETVLGSFTNIDIPVPANPLLSIFGPPRINLKISGAVDIRAAFRNQTSDQQTISQFDRSRNEPDFNQEVQINVNGTIGDKLNILADWNTQRIFEYENQLKIKYTGYEDEIVQSVEAGNVSLATPSAFIGSSQALFGIKAKFQAGPLFLTTLVSQKKGQTRELTVTGGATKQARALKAWQYSKSHYFLDTLYRRFYDTLKAAIFPTYTFEIQRNQVKDIEVWVSPSTQQTDPSVRTAVAYIDLLPLSANQRYDSTLRNRQTPEQGRVEINRFIKLKPSEYVLHQVEGYVTINTALSDEQVVAAAYRIENSNLTSPDDDLFFGEFTGNDTTTNRVVLKLVKPRNLLPRDRPAWDMMLKNIYALGARDLRKENFEVQVLWEQNAGDPVPQILGQSRKLINIVGLDRFKTDYQPPPDDQFDFIPGLTIDPVRGEIIFPILEPFREGIRRFINTIVPVPPDTSDYIFHEVYDTSVTAAQNNQTRNRYIIDVKYEAAQTSRYNLGFNLVEGSVNVLLDGNALVPNADYTVDYITGEVVIRNQRALVPGANLQIKYEQNDLFQLAAKTLIGARGELSPLSNTNLGFTLMNLNQQTLSDKVRLGEEPTNNVILGIDGSTSFNVAPVTSALDALPVYQTREMSTLRISGEAAYMIPDPNTKKSPIASDQDQSIAYIDDFEGARRTIPLGLDFAGWTLASPPVLRFNGSAETAMSMDARAKLNWFNNARETEPVFVQEIWPNRSVRRGEDFVSVLLMDFYPGRRGMYNYSTNIESTLVADPRTNWNGMMKFLSTTGANLLDQNIGFLEIWMRADGVDPDDLRRGRLYVSLGAISEGILPDSLIPIPSRLPAGSPHSEDLVVYNIPNGTLNPGEDVGIDMLTDEEERTRFAQLIQRYPELANDPSGDNYRFSTGDFSAINGLEGNQQSRAGLFPNTEDINNNFQLDKLNSYLEYELPLDTLYIDSLGMQRPNTYIVGGGENRWYQFRIPLVSPTRIVSQGFQTPQDILQNLQFVRIHLSGFTRDVRVRIADINLVGNQWQEFTRNDSVLRVSVVNIEDNPNYTSPPGVIRERDRTQPDQLVFANEQSLALILTKLPVDSMRQAVKNYAIRPLDVFNYRSMKMFVHGDPGFQFNDTSDYDAAIFLRFGSDTSNFYEYRQPVRPGWDGNDMVINFAALASIKALRQTRGDSIHLLSPPVPVENKPGAEYRIRGNPTLTNVRSIWVGIINMSGRRRPREKLRSLSVTPRPLTGEVWINELRLIGVDDTPGLAYRFDTQLKLADLGDVTFNYARIDPQFHGLEQRFGSRVTSINWGLGVNLGLEKFLPRNWEGTSVPFSYSHTENLVTPKYLPSTDVQVDEAASRAPTPEAAENVRITAQTFRVTETYAVPNLRIGLPSQAWYIRDTFNKLTWAFTYTTSRERSPVVEQRTAWQWSGRAGYALTLPPDYFVEPFTSLFDGIFLLDEFKKLKLYYAPTSISAGLSLNRSQTRERVRDIAGERPVGRNFTASRSAGFGYKLTEGGLTNISGDYGLNIESNLTHLETDQFGNQRRFSQILSDLFFKDRVVNFGNDARYGQRFSANSRPKIPPILDIDKHLDLSLGYSVNYHWQNNFQRGDLDKASGWDNNISMTSNFRLKSLVDRWLPTDDQGPGTSRSPPEEPRRRRSVDEMEVPRDTTRQDTTSIQQPEEKEASEPGGQLSNLKRVFKYLIRIPLLEYETINLTYAQTNRVGNSGVVGGPGFLNFWGRLPFFQEPLLQNGPTRLYQLGIVSDPSGRLAVSSSSRFPFVRFDVQRGLRAANASLTDQYGQTNRLTIRTNRALWEGASLELNWNVGWTFNKNTTVLTDPFGVPTTGAVTTSGSVDRSFFSVPPVFFFKVFKSDLQDVGRKYSTTRRNTADRRPDDVKLAEAFENGLEALPLFKKIFGQYFPRINYSFRWDGLERLPIFSQSVERLGIEHAYQSSFTRQWRGDPDGSERTDAERVSYSFSPLLGMNASMKELLKGNVNANIRYNTSTSYDLNVSARNIVETFSQELALTLSYQRRGFEFLLFGVSLSNDLEMGLTYSRTKNSRRTYNVSALESDLSGTPLEGSTRTVLEPRIRYVLSSRVTASIFYRYTRVAPDEGGSFIPGTTTNEAGLDIHIAIQ